MPETPAERPVRDEQLLAIAADWRRTAETWQKYADDGWVGTVRGLPQPPQPGRASIRNWINWLNGCAKQIEDVVNSDV